MLLSPLTCHTLRCSPATPCHAVPAYHSVRCAPCRLCSILFVTPCLGFAFRAIPLVPSEFAAGLTLVR